MEEYTITSTIKVSDLTRATKVDTGTLFLASEYDTAGYVSVAVSYGTLLSDILDQISIRQSLGTASQYDVGTSKNNIPVLDSNGKLPVSVIPDVAITNGPAVKTYIPTVSTEGILTWVLSDNPPTNISAVNIQGNTGQQGPQGILSLAC